MDPQWDQLIPYLHQTWVIILIMESADLTLGRCLLNEWFFFFLPSVLLRGGGLSKITFWPKMTSSWDTLYLLSKPAYITVCCLTFWHCVSEFEESKLQTSDDPVSAARRMLIPPLPTNDECWSMAAAVSASFNLGFPDGSAWCGGVCAIRHDELEATAKLMSPRPSPIKDWFRLCFLYFTCKQFLNNQGCENMESLGSWNLCGH